MRPHIGMWVLAALIIGYVAARYFPQVGQAVGLP